MLFCFNLIKSLIRFTFCGLNACAWFPISLSIKNPIIYCYFLQSHFHLICNCLHPAISLPLDSLTLCLCFPPPFLLNTPLPSLIPSPLSHHLPSPISSLLISLLLLLLSVSLPLVPIPSPSNTITASHALCTVSAIQYLQYISFLLDKLHNCISCLRPQPYQNHIHHIPLGRSHVGGWEMCGGGATTNTAG